jgi:hypothetical protein
MTPLRLGIAAGIALLTAIAIMTSTRDSGIVLLVTVHAIVSFTSLAVALINRRRLGSVLERVRTATPVIATGLLDAPAQDLAALIAEVRRLGFDTAGATNTTIDRTPILTWVLVDASGETWVEAGLAGRPIAVFVSEAGSGRFIETAYPTGEPIDDPRLLSQVVTADVAAALATHREAVRQAGVGVGRVTSLDEYLVVEARHRQRTGGMRIRTRLDRVVRPSIRDWAISLAVDVVCLVALLFWPAPAAA